MYVVRYRRDECIGVAACIAVDDKNWEMGDDAKADLVGGENKGDYWEKDISEEELETYKNAAEVCPVAIIEIFKKENGEKIWPL